MTPDFLVAEGELFVEGLLEVAAREKLVFTNLWVQGRNSVHLLEGKPVQETLVQLKVLV